MAVSDKDCVGYDLKSALAVDLATKFLPFCM